MTWIRHDIIESYQALHAAGLAHSVEVWDRSGNLAGGLYGVAIGKAFITESMFARQPDASKVGFVTLSCHLQKWGFVLNDGKRDSGDLRSLGFTLIRGPGSMRCWRRRVPSRAGKALGWSTRPSAFPNGTRRQA